VIVCGVNPEAGRKPMVGRICEKVGFKAGVKVRELWMRIEESGDSTEEDDVTGVGRLRGGWRHWG